MKRLIYLFASVMAAATCLTSCLDSDDPYKSEKAWREHNDAWLAAKEAETDAQGHHVYERIGCDWDINGYVLMKWHNDRTLTQKELSPISSSTVDVKYEMQNVDSLMIDNSYSRTSPADSIYRTRLNKTISGWVIGLTQMHVGDSVTMIVPYSQGYGNAAYNSVRAYSNLVYHIKLTGIPGYQTEVK